MRSNQRRPPLDGVDVTKESVIQGVVTRDDQPVGNAYVRLLDRTGEFTAEVPTSATGHFRFFAAPASGRCGRWRRRRTPWTAPVVAQQGVVAEVAVAI